METTMYSRTNLDCCQWSSQVEQDHSGVVHELQRVYYLEEEREHNQDRFRSIQDDVQRHLDDLRKWAALSMNAHVCSMVVAFIDKVVWLRQDAESWIRYEINGMKMQCSRAMSNGYLRGFAERTKKTIQETLRFIFNHKFHATSWHSECILKFSKMHEIIIPKLSRLQQCDNIFRDLTFYKRAAPFLQHQIKELQSFATNFLPSSMAIPALLSDRTDNDPFAPLCQLLTGELFGNDPLDISELHHGADLDSPATYIEPISYQAFINIAPPIFQTSRLSNGGPTFARSMPIENAGTFRFAEIVSHARGWELKPKWMKESTESNVSVFRFSELESTWTNESKESNVSVSRFSGLEPNCTNASMESNASVFRFSRMREVKKRKPYKKREKPVILNCELVRKNSPECLTPIKFPKLKGNLILPLN